MTAVMMPGGPVADAVFAELTGRIEKLRSIGYNPGLGTILVGGDSASAGYIRMKMEKANKSASPALTSTSATTPRKSR